MPLCETVNFEKLKPAASAEEYALHVAAVEWSLHDPIVISSKDDIKSEVNWRGRFDPYHHQVENLIRFCRMLPVTLLADDVGLGKTISAGLILAELIERKRVSRVLVVGPALLGPQWVEELGSKFAIPAVFAKGQDLSNAIERSVVPVVVTTYHTASNRIAHIKPDQFDMLILDEAHKLRNLHGSDKPPLMAQRMRKALESRVFKYVLMLTATPIQNRLWDLYSLVDLLTVAKGHRNPLGTPDEFRIRYIADRAGRKLNFLTAHQFRSIIREYVVRTRREDTRLQFPERQVKTRRLAGGEVESEMTELVSAEIGSLSPFVQISISQAMMSSPQALASQLQNMAANGNIEQHVADAARRISDSNATSAKITGLLTIVHELRKERPDNWRLVVFTLRKETQDAIGRVLAAEGIPVGFIRGGASSANQSTVERFRIEPPVVNVIVSTDAGAEGVNLQAGNVLVNYDLPWNPMVMEQRIGRIQRLASKHEHVIVLNLVIANSVEERVVGRLMEKLQAISETIGDIETILESTGQEEDGSFEDMVRNLVIRSLLGQNVEDDARSRAESIERAKLLMNDEKKNIDAVIGTDFNDLEDQPKPPQFEPVKPSIAAEQFVMRALAAEGATLRPRADDTIDIVRPGKPVERLTFKPEVAEREGQGVFMGNAPKLYLPGRPSFERLVQRWLVRSAHCVRDLSHDLESMTQSVSKAWCDTVPDTCFDSSSIKTATRRMRGGIICKTKAANGVDSIEKLISLDGPTDDVGAFDEAKASGSPVISEHLAADTMFEGIYSHITANVITDAEINSFCKFYDQRRQQEVAKTGADAHRRHKVETDFAPRVFADVVAMTGIRYDKVVASVGLLIDGSHRYEIELELIPANGQVLREPAREKCAITGRSLPEGCLKRCDITKKQGTAHLLVKSADSGRYALPEFGVCCAVSNAMLLSDEIYKSDISGKTAGMRHFQVSPVSGRRALKEEFVHCEVTGDAVFPDELVLSAVTGRKFRSDEAAKSAISGATGHQSEFIRCEDSGDTILPEEGAKSDVSGAVVRKDLLRPSAKPPHRVGLERETIICSHTGQILMIDEVIKSAVSAKSIDKDKAVYSLLSGKPALPEEIVRCEVSGDLLLPEETDLSSISNRRVRKDLLLSSPLSGRKALKDEFLNCQLTAIPVLPDELVKSDESGLLFRQDEVVKSSESGRIGHRTEMAVCSATQEPVLASEADLSAVSGKRYRKSLLRPSAKPPHRMGTEAETRTCAITGKMLLCDEVVESAVSKRLFDLDLAVKSDISQKTAMAEEMVLCEATGKTLLPEEANKSDYSGRLVCVDLSRPSPINGRRGWNDEFTQCEISGSWVLPDELIKSEESGRMFRCDEVAHSAESGRVAHASEMTRCQETNSEIFKSESGLSAISGKTCRKSLLIASDKSRDRFGLDRELVTCAKSGKRLLIDEANKSAVSGNWIDTEILVASPKSGRLALPEECVTCEESGLRLLPDETEVCAVTGKRVDAALLGKSDLSGKKAIKERLEACGVSGRLALPSELRTCDVTGKRVDPEELETCCVSHKRAVQYQFVRSDISGSPMLSEHAIWSPVTKRCCTPQEAATCSWRGVSFPSDEIATCRLTGLSFSREYINDANEFRILRNLLDGKEPGADAPELVGWMNKNLGASIQGIKSARCVFSPDGNVRAVCAEVRAMLGLKVRFTGVLVGEKGERQIQGRVVIGKRGATFWTIE